MKFLKAAVLSAALVAAGTLAASAAEPAPTGSVYPPQLATNPGSPYSQAQTPGPKVGSSTLIPAAPYTTTPNSGADLGRSYSTKGFGPNPDENSR
jgi:hypothetical protein